MSDRADGRCGSATADQSRQSSPSNSVAPPSSRACPRRHYHQSDDGRRYSVAQSAERIVFRFSRGPRRRRFGGCFRRPFYKANQLTSSGATVPNTFFICGATTLNSPARCNSGPSRTNLRQYQYQANVPESPSPMRRWEPAPRVMARRRIIAYLRAATKRSAHAAAKSKWRRSKKTSYDRRRRKALP